jgi:hypothetical protein
LKPYLTQHCGEFTGVVSCLKRYLTQHCGEITGVVSCLKRHFMVHLRSQSERAPTSAPGRVDDVCIENNVFVLFLLDT